MHRRRHRRRRRRRRILSVTLLFFLPTFLQSQLLVPLLLRAISLSLLLFLSFSYSRSHCSFSLCSPSAPSMTTRIRIRTGCTSVLVTHCLSWTNATSSSRPRHSLFLTQSLRCSAMSSLNKLELSIIMSHRQNNHRPRFLSPPALAAETFHVLNVVWLSTTLNEALHPAFRKVCSFP